MPSRKVVERSPQRLVELTALAFPVRKRTLYSTYEEWEKANDEMENAMSDDDNDLEDDRNRKLVGGDTDAFGWIDKYKGAARRY